MKKTHHTNSSAKTQTENAFALIHFGSNVKYFELELYFCMMLRNYTNQNIIYMYSIRDTPAAFVSEISPFVYDAIGFDDDKITINVDFVSGYTSFNTLRTCDFIFAYTLTQYKKVCIVESDLVIMKRIGDIFKLNTPAILFYQRDKRDNTFTHTINHNRKHSRTISDADLLTKCESESGLNGGVMLIEPSAEMFTTYSNAIKLVAKHTCKYPNEALFELVNPSFYNLPVKYNLSHYHTLRLHEMGITPADVVIYHFNETEYKHLDTIKEKWLEKTENDTNPKYRIKKLAIYHFRDTVYNPYHKTVDKILLTLEKKSVHEERGVENKHAVAVEEVSSKAKDTEKNPDKEAIAGEDLPSKAIEWIEAYSNKYKRPYWYNTRTQETSWNPVDNVSAEAREVEDLSSKANIGKEVKDPIKEIIPESKEGKNDDSKNVWVRHMSKTRERPYWTNAESGVSVWVDPTLTHAKTGGKRTRSRIAKNAYNKVSSNARGVRGITRDGLPSQSNKHKHTHNQRNSRRNDEGVS